MRPKPIKSDLIKKLWSAGYTNKQLATIIGCHEDTIRRYGIEFVLPPLVERALNALIKTGELSLEPQSETLFTVKRGHPAPNDEIVATAAPRVIEEIGDDRVVFTGSCRIVDYDALAALVRDIGGRVTRFGKTQNHGG